MTESDDIWDGIHDMAKKNNPRVEAAIEAAARAAYAVTYAERTGVATFSEVKLAHPECYRRLIVAQEMAIAAYYLALYEADQAAGDSPRAEDQG